VQRDTFYRPVKVWDAPAGEEPQAAGVSKVLENNLATA
jgi:hypothetical protein